MKKIFAFAFACILAVGAQAQIVSSHSRSITRESNNRDYERVYISYAPVTSSGDYAPKCYDNLTGFNLGYLYGKSISADLPLYLEMSANLQYAWGSESRHHGDETLSMLAINLPANLAYKLPLSDGLSLTPYVGVHVRTNIIGQTKYDGETEDFFSKSDMGDDTANRVQIGGQVGVGLNYNALYIGFAYTTQFGEYMKKWNTGGIQVTLGYEF